LTRQPLFASGSQNVLDYVIGLASQTTKQSNSNNQNNETPNIKTSKQSDRSMDCVGLSAERFAPIPFPHMGLTTTQYVQCIQ